MEKIVDQYVEVQKNIELGLMLAYKKHADLVDTGTMYALDTLIKHYTAETQARTISVPEFNGAEQTAFENAKGMCEWWLGREALENEAGEKFMLEGKPQTPEDILTCLKRIRKSVEALYKRNGRRGYYEYVKEYIKH